jgi:hypothetical protein
VKIGDRVKIVDGSEAHGDIGIVEFIQDNGIILIELDDYGCLWPVTESGITPVTAPEGGK